LTFEIFLLSQIVQAFGPPFFPASKFIWGIFKHFIILLVNFMVFLWYFLIAGFILLLSIFKGLFRSGYHSPIAKAGTA
jgi:hypothetical protein